MLKILSMFFVVVLMGITSCKKNDGPDSPVTKTLFTANVGNYYSIPGASNWLVLHDANGNTIGYRSFQNSSTVKFDTALSLPGNTVTVSLISKPPAGINGPNYPYYVVNTYFNVNIGDVWSLGNVSNSEPDIFPNGSFNIQLNYTQAPAWIEMSDPDGRITYPQPASGGWLMECFIYNSETDFHLIVQLADGSFKQKTFSNVKNQDSYTLNISDLDAVDNQMTFQLPTSCDQYQFEVHGELPSQTNSSGFLLTNQGSYTSAPTTVSSPYPSKLNGYTTNLLASVGETEYRYYKQGGVPSNFVWPAASNIAIQTRGLGNFTSTAAMTIAYLNCHYSYNDTNTSHGDWNVWSSSVNQKLNDFPAELLKNEPDLAFNLYSKDFSTFYVQATEDYQKYLSVQFKGDTENAANEFYFVSFGGR